MSFKKIENPDKRDELVKEYLSLKNKIHNDQLIDRIGETYRQEERQKMYKPLTESNKQTQELIREQNQLFKNTL